MGSGLIHQPVSGGCDLSPSLSGENEINLLFLEKVQVFLKNLGSEWMDVLESIGVNENSPGPVPIFPEHVDQLVSRGSVKIALQA
jgi:hypothetical protein